MTMSSRAWCWCTGGCWTSRSDFAQQLKRDAFHLGKQASLTLEFRFRQRYRLAPTDPRFLNATRAEMLIDHWAHEHAKNPNLQAPDITEDFDEEVARMEAEMLAAAAIVAEKPADDWEAVTTDQEAAVSAPPGAR